MAVIVVAMMVMEGGAWGAVLPPPFPILPLNQVPVPGPPDLATYVKNVAAARKLGKAFYWDMQVGSDGVQSCATCHFRAGADTRMKNQLHPGADGIFDPLMGGPNYTFQTTDFPFHERQNPDFQNSAVIRDVNDVSGSQGIRKANFVSVNPGSRFDSGTPVTDTTFQLNGENTRQVTGRNTPSVINAAFNFANFWDGRANNIFNGENPFGPADASAGVWREVGSILVKQPVAILNASLASQATGPPLSDVEMSFAGRTFPDLGRKMLSLNPLAIQYVHPNDSLLGPLSRAVVNADGTLGGQKGLNTTYVQMIRDAFQDVFWNSNALTPGGFTQMEANFSLFWGLAVQLYEMTLISSQTPFDSFLAGDSNALTPQQFEGLGIFYSGGRCFECHSGPELTGATFNGGAFVNNNVHELINFMFNVSGISGLYDEGYYNVGVRPTSEDIGRGGTTPFFNLLDGGNPFPLSFSGLAELQAFGKLPFATPILPFLAPPTLPTFTNGAFKVPSLRNVELTPPYFHNGGDLTLAECVDFYSRGGNFPEINVDNIPPAISQIDVLADSPERMDALIAFLKTFTDERVRNESAPFDHPELFVPNGEPETEATMIYIPATGNLGLSALPPVAVSLNPTLASPQAAGTPITFTATRIGGSGVYEYRFWLNSGTGFEIVKDYLSENTWTWTPVAGGAYDILVDMRNVGSTAMREASAKLFYYQIQQESTTSVNISSDLAAPRAVGTPITFTAAGSGGTGTYEYRFWLNSGSGFNITQDYSSVGTWTWTPATAGAYDILVDVRSAGSTAMRDASAKIFFYQIQQSLGTSVTLTPDLANPQAAGTPITFTAVGSGGPGPYEYRFWLNSGSGFNVIQDYSSVDTWVWTPATTGNYDIMVDVRTVGSTDFREAIAKVFFYQVQ
jgi:cytochrome c peroxidase